MADRESVRAAREPSVRHARDVESQPGSHDHTRRLEHLGHARSTLRSEVPQDDDGLFPLLDRLGLDRVDDVVLVVKHARLAAEGQPFLTRNFRDATARGDVALEDAEVTGRLDRLRERADHVLAGGERLGAVEVVAELATVDGHDVAVDELVLHQVLEHGCGRASAV